jgi:2-polyprenyl-3-methyl-5-hydroxy-6-metoxy-1,4-benzoquinol methylase
MADGADESPELLSEFALPGGSVEVALRNPQGGGEVGHWVFAGGKVLQINPLWPELCRVDGARAEVEELDPGFIPWPRMTFLVNGRRVDVVSQHREVMRRHYMRPAHQEVSYAPADPFNTAFHAERLRQVRRLLAGVRGRVLDIGSGYSLVGMARPWNFDLFACDWDDQALHKMNNLGWVQSAVRASVEAIPFREQSFDAVFAGEIIEHLVERRHALRTWVSLLRPGGRLVLTTPNRRHLLARVSGHEEVQNAEHLHEYTVAELCAEIREAGARVRRMEGLCLPLPIYVPRRGWRDAVITVFCRYAPNHPTALRRLVALGRPFPRLATNIAVVAERS